MIYPNMDTPANRMLANGTVLDETGKMITGPTVPPFNKPEVRAKAAETRRKRYEMTQNRMLRGMCEKATALGLIPLDTKTPAGEMVQAVAAKMTEVLFDDSYDAHGRPAVDARSRESVRKGLFADAGLTPRPYARDDAEPGGAHISIDLAPDTVAAIFDVMQKRSKVGE